MAIEENAGSPEVETAESAIRSLLERASASVLAIEQYARTATAESTAAVASSAAASTASTAAAENQAQAVAAAADAQSKLAEVAAIANLAAAARTQITDAQAIIATKSTHIEDAQKHADKVRADLDRALTSSQADLTAIDGVKTRTESVADTVSQLHAAVTKNKADTDADSSATRQALAAAKESAAAAKKLADKADETDLRIADYETRLADLEKRSKHQLETITGLLPGATSAGLASAFDTRRQTFLEPSKRWQWWFVGSVIALFLVAATGLAQLYWHGNSMTYEGLMRVWLARVPVAAALIWLALYASRESALAKRLEEDYGYKAAIAASFQGFQNQMKEIGATVVAESPLGKLCHDTLTTIASPPGRIYDKHELVVSPSGEIKDLIGGLTEALSKVQGK